MAKGYKIKHHTRVHRYRSPVSIAVRVLLSVALVVGLAFVGWNAYEPISAYLSGTLAAPASAKPPASSSEAEAASSQPAPTEPEAVPEPQAPENMRAVYLPTTVLLDTTALDARLSQLATEGYNAILFDLKNNAGRVSYRSAIPQSESAQGDDLLDLSALCKRLQERGFTPIGRLHAFRDPIAADVHRSMSVKYMNTQTLWLDNSANNGGKPWLNPFSDEARAYVIDLAAEAAQMGVQQIVLDSVNLPIGYMLEYASFGVDANAANTQKTLSDFVKEAETRVKSYDATLSLYVSGLAALGAQDQVYGGNPLKLASENILLGMMPSQFGDNYSAPLPLDQTGTFTIDKPILSPYATVDQLYLAVAPTLEGKQVTAMLQGATATGAFKNNKMYTAEDISEQVRALTKNNVGDYVLYSPDGSYPTPTV